MRPSHHVLRLPHKSISRDFGDPDRVTEAGEIELAKHGPKAMVNAMVDAQQHLSAGDDTRDYWLAQISAIGGNVSGAMHYLKLAVSKREVNLLALSADPSFASMRQAPEFQAVVARIGVARPYAPEVIASRRSVPRQQ